MDNTSGVSALDLDVEAGLRQAIGVQFEQSDVTPVRLGLLERGEILLPPHPKWQGNFTDWKADPYEDRNWKFQFHTLRWINPLVWSALEGNEEHRREWLRIVKSWHEANVPVETAPSPFAWKDMGDGNRAVQLCIGASLPEPDDFWFRELLEAHRDWLMDDQNIVLGNHALHQNIGLFVVGAVLRDQEAKTLARERMIAQFQSAFHEDGINEEGSVAYHQLNIVWWKGAAKRVALEQMPFPTEVSDRLATAGEALAHLVLPNGRLTQIGDGSRGSVRQGISEQCDFVATGGLAGSPPSELVRQFEHGYYASRSGWGESTALEKESHLLLRHGGRMIGHAHEDRGSVHVYSEGTAWLVDSGFHSYQNRDPTRKYLNSREAHNVATLVGLNYTSPDQVPIVASEETDQYHFVEIEDEGFTDNVLRRRLIYFTEIDCWIVHDVNCGDAPGDIRQSWHVDIGISSNRHDRGFVLRRGKARLVMTWLGQVPRLGIHPAVEGDLRGWIGTKWKTLEPGALITAALPASNSRGLVALITPSGSNGQIGIVHSYVTSSGVIYVVLNRNDRSWSVRIESARIEIEEI